MKKKIKNLYSIFWKVLPKRVLVHVILTIIALAAIAPPLFILITFIRDIPLAIEESALIDGANRYQILFRIILPLVAPGVAATFFINLIFSWNEFLFAYFLTTSDATTLTVAIMKFVTAYSIEWGNITAATVLAMGPLIIAGIFMQNYLIRGLTLGAVKR